MTTTRRAPPDVLDDLGRVQRILKEDLAAEELRHEDAHELPEDVAQRDEAEEAERVHDAFPTHVLPYLLFERREVGEKVRVRQHDAARLSRRSRSVDNLDDVVAADAFVPV